MHSYFVSPPQYPSQFYLQLKTNLVPSETSWRLLDENNNILINRTGFTSNKVYRDTFNLQPGCYSLRINDSGCDGLYFGNNSDGTGTAALRSSTNATTTLYTFANDFGCYIEHRFTVGYSVPTAAVAVPQDVFNVFPNPTEGHFTTEINLAQATDCTLRVRNSLGQIVREQAFYSLKADDLEVHLPVGAPAGVYYVELQLPTKTLTQKVIVINK